MAIETRASGIVGRARDFGMLDRQGHIHNSLPILGTVDYQENLDVIIGLLLCTFERPWKKLLTYCWNEDADRTIHVVYLAVYPSKN